MYVCVRTCICKKYKHLCICARESVCLQLLDTGFKIHITCTCTCTMWASTHAKNNNTYSDGHHTHEHREKAHNETHKVHMCT